MKFIKFESNFNNLKSNPLSDSDLKNVINYVPITKFNKLQYLRSIDEVLNNNIGIILILTEDENTGHWIGIIKQNDIIEIFDPYGSHPKDYLRTLRIPPEYNLNGDTNILIRLIKNSGYRPVINKTRFQVLNDNIDTCGKHVLLRLLLSHLSLKDYTKLIKSVDVSPDDLVSGISYILLNK